MSCVCTCAAPLSEAGSIVTASSLRTLTSQSLRFVLYVDRNLKFNGNADRSGSTCLNGMVLNVNTIC